jgi:hypothetical protein
MVIINTKAVEVSIQALSPALINAAGFGAAAAGGATSGTEAVSAGGASAAVIAGVSATGISSAMLAPEKYKRLNMLNAINHFSY